MLENITFYEYVCDMHDSKKIANQFLKIARGRGGSLTPMQLLKLVYIAHGWSLGLRGVPLTRDAVQAWQYGPVIPRLYNKLRKYKGSAVTEDLSQDDIDPLSADEMAIISETYDVYGNLTGMALSRITHAKGTPWDIVYEPGEFGLTIPTDIIEDHYRRLAQADE